VRKTFVRDLALGKAIEQQVSKLLTECGFSVTICKEKEYDILAEHPDIEEPLTFEVKNDIYANKSGNIAIEVFNPKSCKPSGLGATEALFWVHNTDRCYITLTKSLREYIEKNPPDRIIAAGGDDNATLYLYKADVLLAAIFQEMTIEVVNKLAQQQEI
jgi:hypothetical protein